MKQLFIILIVLLIAVPSMAKAKIWVAKDAIIAKKAVKAPFAVTKAMKDEIKALDEITVQKVKGIVGGSSSQAKQAIEELEDAKEILTKEARYAELYPSATELTP